MQDILSTDRSHNFQIMKVARFITQSCHMHFISKRYLDWIQVFTTVQNKSNLQMHQVFSLTGKKTFLFFKLRFCGNRDSCSLLLLKALIRGS